MNYIVFFLNFGGQEQLTPSECIWPESAVPPPMWNLLISLETSVWLKSEFLWVGTHPRTCSTASTCYTQAHSIHAKEKPVIHFIVMWLQGTVHINKCVSLLCICLYIPHDGFRKKDAMHFLWQSCQTPSSDKKQYITRLFIFHSQ